MKTRPSSRRVAWRASLAGAACSILACAPTERRFPLEAPLWQDTDLRAIGLPCRPERSNKDPHHVACAPEEYVSPLIWDGVDNLLFRPLSEAFAVAPGSEAVNVNSLDETPDSAWFTNRIAVRPPTLEELMRGACDGSQRLDPSAAADATWVIDKGKANGSSPGFRVSIPGKGKFMFKSDSGGQPERPSAASAIGAAVYHAAGFFSSCEQVVYFKPSLLRLAPGLRRQANFGGEEDFDAKALAALLADTPRRGDLVRMQVSAWLPGRLIGPFRYAGTRADDPNDVIPHEDRRDLRGGRLLAAWLDHYDAREQNTMDAWISERSDQPDASPGHVVHYYLDTSDCLGAEWAWDDISRRLGHSYIVDWGDVGADFITLGIPLRPWDRARRKRGREKFGYFDADNFNPEDWKNEYANAAFSRMTERDGAWMARVLARFTPAMVAALAAMGDFTDPADTAYVTGVLEGRLEKILNRYLTRLSPIADVHVEGADTLCGVDLAERRTVRGPRQFHYAARSSRGVWLNVERLEGGRVCVALPHFAADGSAPDDDGSRYTKVVFEDGVASGSLVAALYDLGPARGFRLAGLERPEP
ncbi:MAG: hypothetical protein M3O36_17780 [Myxococcota bacterium]|nr:hypothetical protein [Myxococcota bacterium]